MFLGRFTRGLRFRLMASYALFFALVLVGVAWLFRNRLETSLVEQSRGVLSQEWAAMKGYLRIEQDGMPRWFFDRDDPDESYIVNEMRRIYLLADAEGKPIQWSTTYHEALGIDSAEEIRALIRSRQPVWRMKRDARGAAYLVRSGIVYDEQHRRPYYVALGRSLAGNAAILRQYTWIYAGVIPLGILAGCVMGWLLAGRALSPVKSVASTAERITGSNLSLRIGTRGAGDELDYLIETFNRMIERLERSFQQIRQFSTDVSHELRTPITAIRGQLEVALFTAETTEQYRDAVLNALQDIERLSQIVRALLLLSQAESGQVALQKERLDLAGEAREIVDQFQIPAEAAHVRLESDLRARSFVEADRIQIGRLISNLVSNALKFTPAGGRARVTVEPRGGKVALVVEDSGCGIPPGHLNHIFDRFYRVPGAGRGEGPERGLGLGLSFVAWIAAAHGGKVDVESEPEKGSRFTVLLPAAVPPHESDASSPAVAARGMKEL